MSFTWFNKFSDVMNLIEDEEDKKLFAYAIAVYGTSGEVIDLEYPINALFEACREDIDNSVRSREYNTGGRPKISRETNETSRETTEETSRENQEQTSREISREENNFSREEILNTEENGVIDFEKPPVIENEKPKPNQSKPDQTRPNQAKERVRTKFAPPAPAQVREYAAEKGLNIDPERFCDYFAAQGWRISNGNPMKDWKAAVRNWAAREGPAKRYAGKVQGQEVESGFDYDAYCGF
jgi:hypothetical protein